MTQNENRPSPGRNYGETAVFTFGLSVFLAKNAFYTKKTPKVSQETDIYLGKGTFFLQQLFLVVAGTGSELRSRGFFRPKILLAKISDFCHQTPILVNGPVVALGVIFHFPPFIDFCFPSFGHFGKNNRLTRQKVFPLPTVRTLSASKGSHPVRKVQFILTLFKRPLTPPLLFEHLSYFAGCVF